MKASKYVKSLILITLMISTITGCSKDVNNINNNSNNVANTEQAQSEEITQSQLEKEEVDLPSYKVALIDDANIGNIIRQTLHIVVDGEYTLDQLYDIAKKEALAYTYKNKVNALAIGFYEDEGNIGHGYDMGRVEYVPYGDWSKATEVKSGDYSNFEFVNYLEKSISSSLEQGKPIAEDEGVTDINLVKSDIKDIYDGLTVNVTKNNDTLIVNITESKDNIFGADEITISGYTDWCLNNIKSDIKTIDFTVNTNNGSVRALLQTSEMKTDNGRYFDTDYIAQNIQ